MEKYDIISEAPAVLQIMNLGKPKRIEYENIMNFILLILIGYFVLYLVDKIISWWAFRDRGFPYRHCYDKDYQQDYEIKKKLFD